MEERCAITDGGALSVGFISWVENKLGAGLLVPPEPQFVTALGAAIMAEDA